jgi:hypothetical protein
MSRSIQFQTPALLLLIAALVFPCLSFAGQYKCTRVVDGDTDDFELASKGREREG